jgi:hypothetical protein
MHAVPVLQIKFAIVERGKHILAPAILPTCRFLSVVQRNKLE